jgi:magnesium chelatase family protein
MCGWLGHPRKPCRCTPGEIERYRSKISGPILDRIDLRIEVQIPPVEQVGHVGDVAESVKLREQIAAARARQADRYSKLDGVHCNAQAGPQERRTLVRPRREAEALLRRAMSRWNLTVRAHERTLSVARSIADLDAASDVDVHHVAEALQYRLDSQEGRDPGR